VSIAVQKATHEAYKNIFSVPVAVGNTVPYPVVRKFKSAVVKLLPASAGTGMKAGSAVRSVLELAGYENMLSKIIGTNNKLNNALATIYALAAYKHASHFSASESKSVVHEATVEKNAEAITNESAQKKSSKSVAPKAKSETTKKAAPKKTPAKKPAAKKAEK
jgi:ribosomal protein S5